MKTAALGKMIAFLLLLLFPTVLFGCAHPSVAEPPKQEKTARVKVYDIPEGVARYGGAEVKIGETELPVYAVQVNVSQSWTANNYRRKENGVCMFELDGSATVTVKPDVVIGYRSVMRPLSAKITPVADLEKNTLSLTFRSAGEFVLEINGDPYNAIHFFVSEYGDGQSDAYTGYRNVMLFEAGLHTAQNDGRIGSGNTISVAGDTLVYLADGAVVRGRFLAANASNIAVAGRGIIDGSAFERDAAKGSVTVPLEFNDCRNVLLKDFTVLDPAGWCVNFYFTQDSRIENIKIITSRSNGDGISLQSCKNVTADGCFVRSWDDSLVVKNYPRWENRNIYGETENIIFRNCTLWTDLAQSMELGYETVGERFCNITFENVTVLHAMHKAVMSIHNANNALIEDVTFRNITVEDGLYAAEYAGLFDFRILYSKEWSDQHTSPTPLGEVTGVTAENIKVVSARKITGILGGCYDDRAGFESAHCVNGVTIRNVSLAGLRPALADCRFTVTDADYLNGFEFVQEEEEVTGATFTFTQTEEYLASFGAGCQVERV